MDLRGYIGTVDGCLAVVLVLAVLTATACELINGAVMRVVARKSWWPSAEKLQKQLMMNFGYPEEACTPEVNLESYAYVLLICGDHLLMGALMLPVVVLGWSEAGPTWQLLFMMAALADMGYDVYDFVKKLLLTFFPSKFERLGAACPLSFFVIMCCMHHPLAMILVIPMNLHYSYVPEYHKIACSLLLAAGIGFLSGQYKFTLNVMNRREFLQYKAIVLLQFLTIWYTRFFVWFPNAYSLLKFFHEQGDVPFLVGGAVGTVGMSLFNIVTLLDCTTAAVKWLPRPLPSSRAERDGLRCEIAQEQSHTILPSSPTASSTRRCSTTSSREGERASRCAARSVASGQSGRLAPRTVQPVDNGRPVCE